MKIHISDFTYMTMMDSLNFFKQLADETRLKSLMLIEHERELCVCELTYALGLSQPKVSRHLAQLKAVGVLSDRREGKWVYYSINNNLLAQYQQIIKLTCEQESVTLQALLNQLSHMGERPIRQNQCC